MHKKLQDLSRRQAQRAAAVGVTIVAATGAAHAALPAGITDGIETAGADLVTAGVAIVVALLGFWGIRMVGKKLGLWS